MKTLLISAALFLSSVLGCWTALADDSSGLTITFGKDARALHMPVGNATVHIEPAFEDYTFMLFDVCDSMKLTKDECLIFPMNGDLGGNAIAAIFEGNRVLVYDRTLSPDIGYEGAMTVIAHEVGHFYCGHTSEEPSASNELEADRFAGGAMRMGGMTLQDTLSVASILDERPSLTHPGKAARIRALREGWNSPEATKDCRGR